MGKLDHLYRLENRVALITGAGGGIGRATALNFADAGAHLVLTDIDLDAADETAAAVKKAGGEAVALLHDVTDESHWQAAVKKAHETFSGLHIMINNAGVYQQKPLDAMSLADFRKVMDINVDGVWLGIKTCLRPIGESCKDGPWGSIINLSSVAGLTAAPFLSAYNTSKGAVRLMSKSAALEAAALQLPVRVNSIHPAVIETNMGEDLVVNMARMANAGVEQARAGVVQAHPIGRFGKPEEIASAIRFLASEAASFMTGSELVVDGGLTAR